MVETISGSGDKPVLEQTEAAISYRRLVERHKKMARVAPGNLALEQTAEVTEITDGEEK